MGIIFSRFRRKQSTLEVLQQIEDEMCAIEEYKAGTRRRQQRVSAVIVAYSVVLYLAAGLLLYYHYFPDDMTTRLLCVGALLLFPAVVYLLKRLLMWYYGRKISKNELKLASLKKKKEAILEEVQDKETYKVAKQILEKFAPEQLRRSPLRPSTGAPVTPAQQAGSLAVLRQRQMASGAMQLARTPVPATPLGRGMPQPGVGRYGPPVAQSPMPGVPGRVLHPHAGGVPPRAGPPLPRPVLPRERGLMDRMLDYLVGDGPANRYALICCQCQSHNGMALKEEFEYLAFRCSYCFAWNPARKQRPSAPRLPAAPTSGESMVESDTTETSESETEGERASDLPASETERTPAQGSETTPGPSGLTTPGTIQAGQAADQAATGLEETAVQEDQASGPVQAAPGVEEKTGHVDQTAAEADETAAAADTVASGEDASTDQLTESAADRAPAVESVEPESPAAMAGEPPGAPPAEPSVGGHRAEDQNTGSEAGAAAVSVSAVGAGADVPFADDSGADS